VVEEVEEGRGAGMVRKGLLDDLRDTSRAERVILLAVLLLAALVGACVSMYGARYALLGIGAALIAILAALRQFKTLLALILVVRIVQDYYQLISLPLFFPFISIVLAIGLLAGLFLFQSDARPWTRMPHWLYWIALLALCALSMIRSVDITDGLNYYLNIILSGFIFWALGVQLSRTATDFKQLLNIATGLGSAFAVHAIIAARTGVFLFATSSYASYVATKDDLRLSGTSVLRVGSFLLNPDTAGSFFAMVGLLALGLALGSATWPLRALYLCEATLIFLAQLFTYSTASFAALGAGGLVLAFFMTRGYQRLYPVIAAVILVGVAFLVFPGQLIALISHALNPKEYSLRVGVWQTALGMIAANPLTGVGLGATTYLARSTPFLTAQQTTAEAHPHNSYLEYAAMSGIPALIVFLTILILSVRPILLATQRTTGAMRGPMAGALASIVMVSVNSLVVNTWTILPNVAIAWLIVGAAGSPALLASLRSGAHAARTNFAPASPSVPALQPSFLRTAHESTSGATS
jgi:O-antigen ligase